MSVYDLHKSVAETYQVATFEAVGSLVYNPTSSVFFFFTPQYTQAVAGYGLYVHKSVRYYKCSIQNDCKSFNVPAPWPSYIRHLEQLCVGVFTESCWIFSYKIVRNADTLCTRVCVCVCVDKYQSLLAKL